MGLVVASGMLLCFAEALDCALGTTWRQRQLYGEHTGTTRSGRKEFATVPDFQDVRTLKLDREKVRAMFAAGQGPAAIAKALRCSRMQVYRVLGEGAASEAY